MNSALKPILYAVIFMAVSVVINHIFSVSSSYLLQGEMVSSTSSSTPMSPILFVLAFVAIFWVFARYRYKLKNSFCRTILQGALIIGSITYIMRDKILLKAKKLSHQELSSVQMRSFFTNFSIWEYCIIIAAFAAGIYLLFSRKIITPSINE